MEARLFGVCTQCKTEKPQGEFRRSKQRASGYSSWCKACHNASGRRWYANNRAEASTKNRMNWWRNHAITFNLFNPGGSESGLRVEYQRALYRDPCAYCGGPGGELDHIFPARRLRGAVRDRVKPKEWFDVTSACKDCNQTKGTQTLVEFLGWPTNWLRAR